jgi:hypothetical protein
LSFLFDSWPSGQAHGPAQGFNTTLPILGGVKKTKTETGHTSESFNTAEPDKQPNRLAWKLATALLVLVTAANVVWTFREPLLENPEISQWLKHDRAMQPKTDGLLKDPRLVQLVSRDMHTHPTRAGILVLSLTFVNLAQRNQAFPVLEITLLDASNQPVAMRQLQPLDYLRPGADIETGLAKDVYLPVLLELGDPGKQAVGFEIQFL